MYQESNISLKESTASSSTEIYNFLCYIKFRRERNQVKIAVAETEPGEINVALKTYHIYWSPLESRKEIRDRILSTEIEQLQKAA